jgi:ParB family chromosome partitioning protein|tara:strand:- start:397 stop:1248 length:852 start_codon:yes stop_codon:yes gene_type:complete
MINQFKAKKGLGRGLSSLIGDNDIKTTKNKISISSIIKNKFQPRRNFEKEALEELTKSIKERGIIQPIIVRKSKQESGKFEIVAGERRWQAAQNAGLHEVPIVEIDIDDLKSLEFAIVENVQRSDLNPIEEAMGYQRLIDEFNYDQEKVSKFIGKSRSHITNCLRLLSLPNEVKKLIELKQLTQGHAKVLVGMENAFFLAKKIVDKKLSVRQAESLIRALKFQKNPKSKSVDPNITNLETNVEDRTGLKVKIFNKKNNSGNVVFEYKDIDQLNHLLMVIKANY